MKKKKQGFSLIELLVVISVVGILLAVTLTGINASRKSARDGRRKSDLEQIRSALEMYKADNDGNYPDETYCDSSRGRRTSSPNCSCANAPGGSDWNASSEITAALEPNYLQSLPVDLINSSTYFYYYEPVCAQTETICGVSKTCSSGCCAYELGVTLETSGQCYRVCSP